MNLLQLFAQQGMRIFSQRDVAETFKNENFSESYAQKILHLMGRRGELQVLSKGLYALPSELLAGGPLHSFEIAMKLVKKGAISHRSAFFFHNLTDQMMHSVYVTAPRCAEANLSTKRYYDINNTRFCIKRVDPTHFFGVKRFFLGEVSIFVTDLEKTLLDGLVDPNLCGGFREVMYAFLEGSHKISPDVFFGYVQKMPTITAKRAGWVLEKIDVLPNLQQQLASLPLKTIQKLNPAGLRQGSVNKRWMIMENL